MWEEAGMMQNNIKVIIITGSIGTGKSTAVNIIKNLGYKVLDSDKIVHDGYNKGEDLYHKVVERFGQEILNEDKSINRQELGKIVFNDDESLMELNKIVHIYVAEKLMQGVEECKDEVIFLDIPLILEKLKQEKKYALKYDEIWLIYVSPETQVMRLRQRAIMENKNPEDVLNIINKQIPIDEKAAMSDEVIDNEGTVEELELKIKQLLKIKLGR
jgi:dephospho-CoA kinase